MMFITVKHKDALAKSIITIICSSKTHTGECKQRIVIIKDIQITRRSKAEALYILAVMTEDKGKKFWNFIHDMHLYDTRVEALFKVAVLALSWYGGVQMTEKTADISVPVAASLFLFSLSLIMEYTVRLVVTKRVATRILPFLIFAVSLYCAATAFGKMTENAAGPDLMRLYKITGFPLIIICVDVAVHVLIEDTKTVPIETKLKNIEEG